ncbi:MAG: hypothetical protein AAF654_00300 [Myxococcota bacterium]
MKVLALTAVLAATLFAGTAQAGEKPHNDYVETFSEELAERRADTRRKLNAAKARLLISVSQNRVQSRLFRFSVRPATVPSTLAFLPKVDRVN